MRGVLVIAIGVGCGGGSAGSAPESAGEFAETFAERFCALQARCCGEAGGEVLDGCVAAITANLLETDAEATADGAAYSRDRAAACLELVGADSCRVDRLALRELLRTCEVWDGVVEAGGACMTSASCARRRVRSSARVTMSGSRSNASTEAAPNTSRMMSIPAPRPQPTSSARAPGERRRPSAVRAALRSGAAPARAPVCSSGASRPGSGAWGGDMGSRVSSSRFSVGDDKA
jgi:hypothetical protein